MKTAQLYSVAAVVNTVHMSVHKLAVRCTYDVVDTALPFLGNSCRDVIKTGLYYTVFTLSVCAAGSFAPKICIPTILIAFVGGIMQGNPGCPAQKAIEKYPKTAFMAGALNGVLCELAYPYATRSVILAAGVCNFQNSTFCEILSTTFIMPLLCRYIMCPLESNIKDIAEQMMPPDQGNRTEKQCCCSATRG